ncbi:MAG: winged helix-turn-helix domain-containing protein [Nitrososphaerales archaeon]
MVALFATAKQSDQIAPASKFKNRNRIEIVANLLSIARTGTLKTHLMYKANLSYVMITDYLDYLQETRLIQETLDVDGTSRLFQTTEKGLKYLEVYATLQSIAGLDTRKAPRRERELFQ